MNPQLIVNSLISGLSLALLTTGFAFIYQTTRIFDLSFGAIYALGGYVYYYLAATRSEPWPVAVCGAIASTSIAGVLSYALVFWPLASRRASPIAGLLTSIGLYTAITNVLALIFGSQTLGLPQDDQGTFSWHGLILTNEQGWQAVSAVLILPAIVVSLVTTRVGRNMRAVRDDTDLAQLMGVNVFQTGMLSFAAAGAIAATQSMLEIRDVWITPYSGLQVAFSVAIGVVVGGAGRFLGAVIGGFVLGVTQGIAIWYLPERWSASLTFGILILFLLIRPQGALGYGFRVEEVG